MAHAILYPQAEKGGRGKKKVPETGGFSRQRVSDARTVLKHSEKLALSVRDGDISLDDALERVRTQRIKARAIRRCGELLRQYDARPQNAAKQTDGAVPLISRSDAGANAGLSERQVKTAVRVANVPEEEFEAAVESDKPELSRRRDNCPAAPALSPCMCFVNWRTCDHTTRG
jgi:hypothetical protein